MLIMLIAYLLQVSNYRSYYYYFTVSLIFMAR